MTSTTPQINRRRYYQTELETRNKLGTRFYRTRDFPTLSAAQAEPHDRIYLIRKINTNKGLRVLKFAV